MCRSSILAVDAHHGLAACLVQRELEAVRAEVLKPRIETNPTTKKQRAYPGWCRTYVNRQVNRLRHVFKRASENELIPPSVYHGLLPVAGLRQGKSEARESEPVTPVPAEHVDAVVKLLPPPVASMVEL